MFHHFCVSLFRPFLLFVMVLVCISGSAKHTNTKDSSNANYTKNKFGFYTGLGFSGIRDQDPYYNLGKMLGPSPNFSLVYQRNVHPALAIRTGIGYVRKGDVYNYYTGFDYQRTNVKIIIEYVEIPILFTLQTPEHGHSVSPYINAGMTYSFAQGKTKIVSEATLNDPSGFRKNIDKEIFNRLDNALVGSTGFKINGKHTDFFIELQYSYSTSNVFIYHSHNNVISFHTGFLFGK